MPVIWIYGMPEIGAAVSFLESLIHTLQQSVAAIAELKIAADDVTVFFPHDLVSRDLGEELIVCVTGLIPREERTPEVKQRLLNAIRDDVTDYARRIVQQCTLVEVFLHPYEFSSTKRLTQE